MPRKTSSAKAKDLTFRFVIRKYVVAKSVAQTLKHECKAHVHEVFVDKLEDRGMTQAIGFEYIAPGE